MTLLAAAAVGPLAFVLSLRSDLMFRVLPYPDAERLVRIYESNSETGLSSLSPATCALGVRIATYLRMACFTQSGGEGLMGTGPDAWPAIRTTVSSRFFEVVGVRPLIGGTFSSPDVDDVVLSFEAWHDRFSGDLAMVGKKVTFAGKPRTVIAVMPEGFEYPKGTTLWMQENFEREIGARERGTRYWDAIGRLAPSRSLSEARAELAVIQAGLRSTFPASHQAWTSLILPIKEAEYRNAIAMIDGLISLGFMVLLVGCLNIAALAMARSFRELVPAAMRIALGASRRRLVWDLLKADAACLVTGGGLGWLVSAVVLSPGMRSIEAGLAMKQSVPSGMLAAALLSGVIAILGLFPSALRLAKIDEARFLKEGASGASRRDHQQYGRLLALESCIVVLAVLFWAALVLDLRNLQRTEESLATDGLFVAETVRNGLGWLPVPAILEQMPGTASAKPFLLDGVERPSIVFKRPGDSPETRHPALLSFVSPNFFEILGTEFKEGHGFDWALDRKPRVAVVSESLARFLSQSHESALAQRVIVEVPPWELEVVGVAPDLPGTIRAGKPAMVIYVPTSTEDQVSTLLMRARSDRPPDWTATKDTLRRVEPRLTLTKLNPMKVLLRHRLEQPRLLMALGSVIAVTLLSLVLVGTWALARLEVAEREREIGIRMAMGCPPPQAVTIIMLGSASWAFGGSLVGTILGLPLSRSLGAVPWHHAEIPLVLALGISLLVGSVCLLAALGPARGAARLDLRRLLRA